MLFIHIINVYIIITYGLGLWFRESPHNTNAMLCHEWSLLHGPLTLALDFGLGKDASVPKQQNTLSKSVHIHVCRSYLDIHINKYVYLYIYTYTYIMYMYHIQNVYVVYVSNV